MRLDQEKRLANSEVHLAKPRPITILLLKYMAESGSIDEIQAIELPEQRGFHMVVSTRSGLYILHKTKETDTPRIFKSLDSMSDNCRYLEIPQFTIHYYAKV